MIDLLILAILVLLTFLGYKKGFLKTLAGVATILVSFIVASLFCSQVAAFVKTTPVYDLIYRNVENYIEPTQEECDDIYDYGAAELNFPRKFVKDIQKDVDGLRQDLSKTIAEKTADTASKILSMIIIFIAVRLIMWRVLTALGAVKKLPLIGWSDKMLGALFGFLRGFLVVYLILAIVAVSASFNSKNLLVNSVNQSEFAKVMYNNNVFLDFVYKD